MKKMMVLVGLLMACATVPANRYQYQEMQACPAVMDDEMRESGAVRCRALCSSYAKDFASYDDDCKCRCKGGPSNHGGPHLKVKPQRQFDNQS